MKLEIERRWLIKLPLSEEALDALDEEGEVPTRITQTYLTSADGEVKRVRFVETDIWGVKFSHFIQTVKKVVEVGVNEETEQSLDEDAYKEALASADPERQTIDKTRYHLHLGKDLFVLDMFHGAQEGLAILELELATVDRLKEEIELPSYLDVEREITSEPGYSNYSLAKKQAKNEVR